MKIRLTREFNFEMAHALEGYDGLCRNIHGHYYRLFVTVRGEPISDPASPKLGMVMDFGLLKTLVNELIVDRLDHSLVLRRGAYDNQMLDTMRGAWERIIEVDYQPTCENMLGDFAEQLQQQLPSGVELVKLKLYETAKSAATWRLEDQR